MSRILIALGGNALGDTPSEQINIVKGTAKHIVGLIERGHEVVIAHGNGPQVGMIEQSMHDISMPFPECIAMSQGYIGYHLQNSVYAELNKRNINKNVVTLITQAVVDERDEALKNPTKPIGKFYSKDEAEKLKKEKNYIMMEDSGRGYRRVVASPKPIDIIEKDCIKSLIKEGYIVITVGGGGIPVIKKGFGYEGINAVIDKDFASGKVAELVDADYLFILTAVDRIAINFGKKNQLNLNKMSVDEAYKYMEENQFAPGSMLPKVIAAVNFARSKKGRQAVIASLEKVEEVLVGESGTIIYDKILNPNW
ncbi:amino acid (carbamate) kinase [[Clostridium] ultunense Esp]|uniref:Carbamate kinase n=1 Tax=[Clostridium] ultunense Esp TaxID=1288971 RepID=M1ZIZ5_9FIRM|nr:carbamate kinase [Schnuerera ultunensis]CCQ98463.1 amino acid (carbamate) kinase [[Clostridium] ultunense Esp]SHD77653.1 amino acid (carbamate) kinase [[Clostridium] ultunense Esp]